MSVCGGVGRGSRVRAAVPDEASCLGKRQKDQADAETSAVAFAAVKLQTEEEEEEEVLPAGGRTLSCCYSSFLC